MKVHVHIKLMIMTHQMSIAKIQHPIQSHKKSITQKFKAHYDNIILKKKITAVLRKFQFKSKGHNFACYRK